jgi:acetylornithine deacetylase/succinyl-diaminopimelate desuccinylase-like protein
MAVVTQPADEVVDLVSALIRFDTSNTGNLETTNGEEECARWVATQLEEVGYTVEYVESGAPGRGNVFTRLRGSDPNRGALMIHGHLDVVPAEAADWSVHPFSGAVEHGYVWGRGAIDMKNMVGMMIAVARHFKRNGIVPPRDLVFAFVADEEAGGKYGCRWLVENRPDLFEGVTEAIGEVGGFSLTVPRRDGGERRLYVIETAEKGMLWMRLTARGRAGHGSRANPDNAVTKLAAAVTRIGEHRWPVRLTATVRVALTELAALYGIEADLDDVDGLLAKLGPAAQLVEATVRNSANPTMLDAGYKVNVIPGEAVAYVDGRYLPGGEDEFRATLDRLTGPDVEWEFHHREVALQAPVDSPTYAKMRAAVEEFAPEGHVVPYCMSGGTDAKQFSRLGITGYGFTPLKLPEGYDYQAMFHGVDERVPAEALHFGVRVLDRFLRNA